MKRHSPIPVLKSYGSIFAHGVEVPASARTVHISGQVGVGPDGRLAEGGFEALCRQAIANIEAVLASARMSLNDVVKVTVFLTQREDLPLLRDVRAAHLAVAPAVTVVIVAGLHDPDWLVEIEAVAASESCSPQASVASADRFRDLVDPLGIEERRTKRPARDNYSVQRD